MRLTKVMKGLLLLASAILTLTPGFAFAGSPTPPQPGQLPPAPSQSPNPNGAMKLPNTISAPPLTVRDKFDYRVVQSFGLRGFVGAGISAAIGQGSGTPYAWGGGVEGFAKRYGSGFAGNLSRQSFAFVLESALHEDPRYFPSEGQPAKLRILNSLKQVIICKTDDGKPSFAYGRVISTFGAAQFVNTWQPPGNGSVGKGFVRGGYGLGGDFAYHLMQEFIPFTRPRSLRHRP